MVSCNTTNELDKVQTGSGSGNALPADTLVKPRKKKRFYIKPIPSSKWDDAVHSIPHNNVPAGGLYYEDIIKANRDNLFNNVVPKNVPVKPRATQESWDTTLKAYMRYCERDSIPSGRYRLDKHTVHGWEFKEIMEPRTATFKDFLDWMIQTGRI